MTSSKNVSEYLNRLFRAEPSLWLSMECYHYQTRTQYYQDKDGKTQTRTVTDKIVTFRTREPVHILSCRDATQNPIKDADLKEYQLTKINLTKSFAADKPFMEQVNVFRMLHASRDLHYEMRVHYDLQDFKNYIMSYVPNHDDDNKMLVRVSWYNYMLAHLLVVPAFAYRLWISSQTSQRDVHIQKHVNTAGPSPAALSELKMRQNRPAKGAVETALGGLANLFLGIH